MMTTSTPRATARALLLQPARMCGCCGFGLPKCQPCNPFSSADMAHRAILGLPTRAPRATLTAWCSRCSCRPSFAIRSTTTSARRTCRTRMPCSASRINSRSFSSSFSLFLLPRRIATLGPVFADFSFSVFFSLSLSLSGTARTAWFQPLRLHRASAGTGPTRFSNTTCRSCCVCSLKTWSRSGRARRRPTPSMSSTWARCRTLSSARSA